ncbi:hypothetical protein NAPIS_ORF02281 [Vairimorpha apis BRL 01]|uniref:Uncharacterized protein n=1 Tax=Vairimorpha apis BRL 01 TaxID=1037528 RepID=T0MGI6_9MICR|nr:hypothetical protein NAPIS_ORF02281 [Vairimorpha apis BRL 01]
MGCLDLCKEVLNKDLYEMMVLFCGDMSKKGLEKMGMDRLGLENNNNNRLDRDKNNNFIVKVALMILKCGDSDSWDRDEIIRMLRLL